MRVRVRTCRDVVTAGAVKIALCLFCGGKMADKVKCKWSYAPIFFVHHKNGTVGHDELQIFCTSVQLVSNLHCSSSAGCYSVLSLSLSLLLFLCSWHPACRSWSTVMRSLWIEPCLSASIMSETKLILRMKNLKEVFSGLGSLPLSFARHSVQVPPSISSLGLNCGTTFLRWKKVSQGFPPSRSA